MITGALLPFRLHLVKRDQAPGLCVGQPFFDGLNVPRLGLDVTQQIRRTGLDAVGFGIQCARTDAAVRRGDRAGQRRHVLAGLPAGALRAAGDAAVGLRLRRAVDLETAFSGVIVVNEPDRVLTSRDVESVLKLKCVAEIPYTSEISRRVDSGLLKSRLPMVLQSVLSQLISLEVSP